MALIGFKVLASSNFDRDIIMVDFLRKTMFDEAHLQVLLKEGLFGKKLKFFKGQLKEAEIVHEEQISSDAGQRIKNAALGTVLLGPIGLLGATFGGAKSILKVRITTNLDQILLIEIKPKDFENLLKDLMDVDIQMLMNKHLSKKDS